MFFFFTLQHRKWYRWYVLYFMLKGQQWPFVTSALGLWAQVKPYVSDCMPEMPPVAIPSILHVVFVVVQMPSVAIMCVVSVLRYSIYGSTQNKGTFFMSISIILLTSIISYSHLSLSLKLNYYSCLAPSLQFFWMNGERFRRKHPCPIMQTCIEWQTGFQEVSTCCLCHNCENSKCSCIVTDRNLITPQVEIMFFWVGV